MAEGFVFISIEGEKSLKRLKKIKELAFALFIAIRDLEVSPLVCDRCANQNPRRAINGDRLENVSKLTLIHGGKQRDGGTQ